MVAILLKAFVASTLLLGTHAISCYIGDESGVETYKGFDYCTAKYTQHPFTSSYGGEKFERGFDKPINRLGTECIPKLERKAVSLSCRCFEDECNREKNMEEALLLHNMRMQNTN